ncbi:DoxX family protein [Archangium violaceum]|uniref:DoxX family protein n=1 Tax=Archangium violaceum TaxID=83451 RepID=UPI002B2AA734|nr:DoxX family protein [Archangium violaceum]
MKRLFYPDVLSPRASLGLLALRLLAGVAMMHHGWGKIQNPFDWMGPTAPVPGFLQGLAALSEFGGGLALVLGLLTPLAMFGLLCTMAFASFFHISNGDPFVGKGGPSWELAGLYFVISLCFILCGPGSFSLDAKLFRPAPSKA